MPKLIVKPAINFLSTYPDLELWEQTGTIAAAIAQDPDDFPDPMPPPAAVSAKNAQFLTAINAAKNGGKLLTMQKNVCRAEIVVLMKTLAAYVAIACEGDIVKLVQSRFPMHKPTRHAIGQLLSPAMPTLRHGVSSGEIAARTRSVRGVFVYTWQVALASARDEIIQTRQSTGASIVFSGFIPGEVYLVRVNAVGAAGPSDFSQWGQLRAL